MNHLAPRQGKFAIVLLISFCLHFLMLTFSSEKSQYEQRPYGCFERQQKYEQRIDIRYKNRKARWLAPPAQVYLVQDKYLQQHYDAKA